MCARPFHKHSTSVYRIVSCLIAWSNSIWNFCVFFCHNAQCRRIWWWIWKTTTVAFVAVSFCARKENGPNMAMSSNLKFTGFSFASLAESISGDYIQNWTGMRTCTIIISSTKNLSYFWNMRWPGTELISFYVQSTCNLMLLPTLFFDFEFNSFYIKCWWKNKLQS